MAETKSAADICNDISASYALYAAELGQAGPHWETKPAAGDGEDAWCARQVAEHIAGAGLFFGQGIAQAIGVEAPQLERISLASADEAVAKTNETHSVLMSVVEQVSDSQLGMEIDHPRLGKQTLGGILGIVDYHLKDHAGQLKALRG